MYLIIPIKPFPAKRLNAKGGRFTKTAIDYHNKKKALEPYLLPHSEEIMRNMIEGTYHLQFHTKMADSWSEKKKKEMDGKPNQNTPDIDNLFKAFTDTLFYNKDKSKDDCKIWNLSASKHWAREDKIIFICD